MSISAVSFYVTGGTVQRDAPCYVERQADAGLYQALMQGSFCYVLTSRQMGKSSLMVRTATRLREEGVAVAVLDLTAIGQNLNPEQWYNGLLNQIGQRLDLEDELDDFAYEQKRLSPLQRWMRAIREVLLVRFSGRVVIFVDEIDAVRSLPFSTDEFFAAIREFYNRRTEDPELERLTFCLLGVATPSDLIRDTRTTPFNIGRRIELNDFTVNEAASLARGLMREERLAAELLKRILYWTGGHPYLTQKLCQGVAEDRDINSAAGVDQLCNRLFFSHRAQERDDNLLFVRERILRSELDLAGLLELYKRVYRRKRVRDEEANRLVDLLRLSGITRVEDGYLRVRNRIYQRVFDLEWVKANMPDAELQRQRAAFYRGVFRTAVASLAILAVMAVLVFIAVDRSRRAEEQRIVAEQERRRAQEEARRADENLQKAIQSANIAEEARKASAEAEKQAIEQKGVAEQQRGQAVEQRIRAEKQELENRRLLYAAHMKLAQQAWETGNISRLVELLEGQKPKPGQEDLRGFEWYFLSQICHNERFAFEPADRDDPVWALAFSPDGKILAAGGGEPSLVPPKFRVSPKPSTVSLWDVATGERLATLKGHTDRVQSLAFSPDGKTLATGSDDQTVKLWDFASGKELATLKGLGDAINSVAFSPDGKRLAAGSNDGTYRVWDVASKQVLITTKGNRGYIVSILFSPDGRKLAIAGSYGTVKLWDGNTFQELITLNCHNWPVRSISFSPDSKRLATAGGEDRNAKLWDVTTGQELANFEHTDVVWSVEFSPDGKLLATGSSESIVRLWDVSTGRIADTIRENRPFVNRVAFSPNGRFLATAGWGVKLWDLARGQEALTLKGHTERVSSVAFSPDGKILASGSFDNTVKLWDVAEGKELRAVNFPLVKVPARYEDGLPTIAEDINRIYSVAFSPDGKILAAGGDYYMAARSEAKFSKSTRLTTGMVKLWDPSTGRELGTFRELTEEIKNVVFSKDGKKLIVIGFGDRREYDGRAGRDVKILDVANGQILSFFLKGQKGGFFSMPSISSDGQRVAAKVLEEIPGENSPTSIIKIWDIATGQELGAFNRQKLNKQKDSRWVGVFSPDGKRVAAGENPVELLDVATGEKLVTFRGQRGKVLSIAFSPDGRRLATGSSDGTVNIWDVTTGQELITLKGHTHEVMSIAFSPDGKTLATGSNDFTVRLWRAVP